MLSKLFSCRRRIFIDGGGHIGSSVRKFRSEIDLNTQYEIFTFEPNPDFANEYSTFQKHCLMPNAVWIDDGEMDFFLDREDGDGSTLIKEKTTREEGGIGQLDKEKPLRVRTIDISSFIKRNFKKNDYIVLKLDIEGAEYKVLNKLLEDGTIHYINKLFIEWHWFKIGLSEAVHQDLVTKLEASKIPVTEWDATEWEIKQQTN